MIFSVIIPKNLSWFDDTVASIDDPAVTTAMRYINSERKG